MPRKRKITQAEAQAWCAAHDCLIVRRRPVKVVSLQMNVYRGLSSGEFVADAYQQDMADAIDDDDIPDDD